MGRRDVCPACGDPRYGDDDPREYICGCGQPWSAIAPFPASALLAEEWDQLRHLLMTRSGGHCEVASPDCLAPTGLHRLPRSRISLHHRSARGMGGTSAADIHSLANLVLVCGHGTIGCHGWIEHHGYGRNRDSPAYRYGYLVPHAPTGRRTKATDPAQAPLWLRGRRFVLLDPVLPAYIDLPLHRRYATA